MLVGLFIRVPGLGAVHLPLGSQVVVWNTTPPSAGIYIRVPWRVTLIYHAVLVWIYYWTVVKWSPIQAVSGAMLIAIAGSRVRLPRGERGFEPHSPPQVLFCFV